MQRRWQRLAHSQVLGGLAAAGSAPGPLPDLPRATSLKGPGSTSSASSSRGKGGRGVSKWARRFCAGGRDAGSSDDEHDLVGQLGCSSFSATQSLFALSQALWLSCAGRGHNVPWSRAACLFRTACRRCLSPAVPTATPATKVRTHASVLHHQEMLDDAQCKRLLACTDWRCCRVAP